MSNRPLRAASPSVQEVATPDLLGAAPGAPHAVVVHVERVVAQEVDRADDVVEVASLQEVGDAVLGAGDEIGLDPQAQVGVLAHEAAVLVEVVAREFAPQRMLPHLQRLREAVDVLGHAQLGRCRAHSPPRDSA